MGWQFQLSSLAIKLEVEGLETISIMSKSMLANGHKFVAAARALEEIEMSEGQRLPSFVDTFYLDSRSNVTEVRDRVYSVFGSL